MTISEQLQSIRSSKQSIKTAIEAKGVSVGDIPFAQYADKILDIGDLEAPENDVIFYDYDGFKVASYTIDEAKQLSTAQLPTPPAHKGLVFQGWNWSINDIRHYNRRYANIGALYTTEDGSTRIRIVINDPSVDKLSLYIRVGDGTSLNVDFGDSTSSNKVVSSAEYWLVNHSYSQAGTYIVKLYIVDSTLSSSYGIFNMSELKEYIDVIKEINFGDSVVLDQQQCLSYLNCKVSFAEDTVISNANPFNYTSIPQLNFPPNTTIRNGMLYYIRSNVSFPKVCDVFNVSANNTIFYYSSIPRFIIPDLNDDLSNMTADLFTDTRHSQIVSIPSNLKTSGKLVTYSMKLRHFEVESGYVPAANVNFSYGTALTTEGMVDLFNKLGTTSTAITLQFGSTNLEKLTSAQKSIATNKGYTLA